MDFRRKSIFLPSLSTAILLLIAIFPIKEYSYFIILRWVVCFSAIYVGYFLFQEKRYSWTWLMGIIAVLFNPIEPIHLNKGIWQVIDLIVAGIFFVLVFSKKKVE
jgi:hypothetical protein